MVPRFALTRGQVAWTVCRGQTPEQSVLDQLRYLKQIGIPFAGGAQEKGRGNRVTYSFYDLMDVAVAFEALRRNVPARLLKHLVERRTVIRKAYRDCFKGIPEVAYADRRALKARHQTTLYQHDFYISFEGRFSSRPGDTQIVDPNHLSSEALEDLLDQLMNGSNTTTIALTPLMIPMVVYAEKAPYTPTGPKL
ncbi:hypothetical protein [Rhodanobacter sp. L36]|uniref:hypothetical protein n=1 Tax=Rhodanobacter sp. L36 TaxID=1747221 RepID=UPI00131ED0F5|nr:hypothetical protein [Rhodanobacter sp. L36]